MLFPILIFPLLLLFLTKPTNAGRHSSRRSDKPVSRGIKWPTPRPTIGNNFCLPWEYGCGMGQDDCIALWGKKQCCKDETTWCWKSQVCVEKGIDGEGKKMFGCGEKGAKQPPVVSQPTEASTSATSTVEKSKTSSVGSVSTTATTNVTSSADMGSKTSAVTSVPTSATTHVTSTEGVGNWTGFGPVQKGESASTTSTQTMTGGENTWPTTTTTSTSFSNSTISNYFATPTLPVDSSGNRLAITGTSMILGVVHGVHALVRMSPAVGDCCGDICCPAGEVCIRSTSGVKCWPKAGGPKEMAKEEGDAIDAVTEKKHEGKVKTAIVPKAEDGAPPHGLPQQKPQPAMPIPQFPPIALRKRWSCHEPKRDCGSSGCYQPGIHACCKKPGGGFLGDYGLCMAEKGETCCGVMCCPQYHTCSAEGEYLCVFSGP